MTLPRLYAMNDYWKSHPPIHAMIAAYFGIKRQPKISEKELKIDFLELPEYED